MNDRSSRGTAHCRNARRQTANAPPATARWQDQAGFTLLELLLAIALTALLVGPLAAWTITIVRQQGAMGEHLSNATSTGRVRAAFDSDVASARTVTAGVTSDCTGGGPGGLGTVRLSFVTAGSTSTKVVYTEAPASGSGTHTSLWRRTCTDTGALASAAELFPSIRPGSVVARCPLPAAPPPAPPSPTPAPSNCAHASARRVQLQLTPDGPSAAPRPVVVQATRRADAGAIGIPGSGNRPPIAQIEVDALVGYIGLPFRFSGAGSEDLDGPLAPSSYRWELPGPGGTTVERTGVEVDHSFSELGEHTVVLQVTDAEGAVNLAAITVRVVNRHPTAVATVSPETGEVDVTSFHFSASSSTEADVGDSLDYSWDLGPGPDGTPQVRTGAEIDVVFPEGTPSGRRQITLTVTDSHGGRDVVMVQIGLGGAAGDGGILMNPEPVITSGAPVVGTVGPGRPDLEVEFVLVDGDPAATEWSLSRVGGAVVATGPGAMLSHSFGENDHGLYRIARVDGTGQQVGADRVFRVNAGPVAAFTYSGASTDSPRSVAFSSTGSSDAEGSIVAWRWNFGFFDSWTSTDVAPTHVFTQPGRYRVHLEVVDSDGATSSTDQIIEVTGPVPAPAAPTWQGDQIVIAAVPGADAYRVHVTCGGTPVVVPGSELPAVPLPSLTLPPGTCTAPAVAAARYELRAGDVWSPLSAVGTRP